MEKTESSYTVGGDVNWRSVWKFLKKLKVELIYDVAILLLGIYPEKTLFQKDTCTPMFRAALFTIVKTWKQPKCPQTDENIKKMWDVHTHTHTHTRTHTKIFLSHKKEWNNATCSNLWPRDYHTQWSKSDKDMMVLWNLKYDTKECIYKTEIDSQT